MTACLAPLTFQASDTVQSPSWTQKEAYLSEKEIRKTGNQIRKERTLFGYRSLKFAWENSCDSGKVKWSSLPELIYDLYEENEIEISEQDLCYLLELSLTSSRTSERADAAIRLLGMLIEEGITRKHSKTHAKIIHSLTILVDHADASRRYNAIMALWQGIVLEGIKSIAQRLDIESDHVIRETANQAIKVLMHYAGSQPA